MHVHHYFCNHNTHQNHNTETNQCKHQMPALNVWWRRWFIGSDDVPFVLIFCVPIVALWIILLPLWLAGLSNATCEASLTQLYVYGAVMIALLTMTLCSCISGIYYGSKGVLCVWFVCSCMHYWHLHIGWCAYKQVPCLRHTSDALWRLAHGCFSPRPSSTRVQQVHVWGVM